MIITDRRNLKTLKKWQILLSIYKIFLRNLRHASKILYILFLIYLQFLTSHLPCFWVKYQGTIHYGFSNDVHILLNTEITPFVQ